MQTGSTNPLKRGATSLSDELKCRFCEKIFSASHQLDKHEKSTCWAAKRDLSELLRITKELVSGDEETEASKRRRLEPGSSRVLDSAEGHLLAAPYPTNITPITQARQTSGHLVPTYSTRSYSQDQSPARSRVTEVTVSKTTETSPIQPFSQLDAARSGAEGIPQSNFRAPTSTRSQSSTTTPDKHGLQKRYDGTRAHPNHNPDKALTSIDIYDSLHHQGPAEDVTGDGRNATNPSPAEIDKTPATVPPEPEAESYAPFPNLSSFELGDWFYSQSTQKSLKDFKSLVAILTSPDFSLDDIKNTKWTRVFQDLGKNKEEVNAKRSAWIDDSGWRTSDIKIEVPVHHRMAQGRGVEDHIAGTLYHRSIVSIVEEKIRNAEDSKSFHFDGHELVWKPDTSETAPEFRVFSELYQSDVFLSAQREVRESPPPQIKDCPMPRVVVGLMFWSDATHLSTFSHSKLWPLYMLFANESKYARTRATSHHVAYFDALSDSFKDYITRRTGGKVPPNGFMAHLNREVFHGQWELILDEELLKAIIEGIVIQCGDGIWRRFFIRIFTYSADYPEKVLIATIRARGDCPCVSCLVSKKTLDQMGTPDDMAFRQINSRIDNSARQASVVAARGKIQAGFAVNGKVIHRLLMNSGVPTINVFSSRLANTGFNIFSALVVDLLHEYEIGVFKALFMHLIRILHASSAGAVLVHELDRRYRATPTFKQTIRKFSSNASQLTRRAARDYEDLLQCAIPVFDGLLQAPLNALVLELLFLNARWHALAKLRLQTEATVILLEDTTTRLGDQFRLFIKETSTINTVKLLKEAEKRERKAMKAGDGKEKPPKTSQKPAAEGSTQTNGLDPSTLPTSGSSANGRPNPRTPFVQVDETLATTAKGARGRGRGISAASRGRGSNPSRGRGARGKGPSGGRGASGPPSKTPGAFRIISQASSSSATAPINSDLPTSFDPASLIAEPLEGGRLGEAATLLAASVPTILSETGKDPLGDSQASSALGDLGEGSPRTTTDSTELMPNRTPNASYPKNQSRQRPKRMNISTVKFHSLGHYPSTIRWFGPTDLYSTEWGEHFHRSPKAWHKTTSRRFLRKELSRHERRRARLRQSKQRILANSGSPKAHELKEQRRASRDPDIHHYVGTSKQAPVSLGEFMPNGCFFGDVASAAFIRKLKHHLLPRFVAGMRPDLGGQALNNLIEAHSEHWPDIVIKDDRIFTHKIMRIKYTTYDARRDEDIIHLETDQSNLMLLNPSYSNDSPLEVPFQYCKVIAILHAEVSYIADLGRKGDTNHYHYLPMEFLWVRWYEPTGHAPAAVGTANGGQPAWLDKVSLRPIEQQEALGFVDPNDVLRACHIIPQFSAGPRFADGKGTSRLAQDGSDWMVYYVNRFVDRDMFMRYEWGLAVGHEYSHKDAVVANRAILATRTGITADSLVPEGDTPLANDVDGEASGSVSVSAEVRAEGPGTSELHNSFMGGEKDEDDEDENEDEDHDEGRGSSDGDSSGLEDVADDSEDERALALFGDEF